MVLVLLVGCRKLYKISLIDVKVIRSVVVVWGRIDIVINDRRGSYINQTYTDKMLVRNSDWMKFMKFRTKHLRRD